MNEHTQCVLVQIFRSFLTQDYSHDQLKITTAQLILSTLRSSSPKSNLIFHMVHNKDAAYSSHGYSPHLCKILKMQQVKRMNGPIEKVLETVMKHLTRTQNHVHCKKSPQFPSKQANVQVIFFAIELVILIKFRGIEE